MEDRKIQVGKRISVLRKNKKMTQEQLGDVLKVKNNTISGYEKGLVYPSIDVLIKMTEIFDCSTDEILGVANRSQTDSDWLYLIRELTGKGYTPFQLNKIIEKQEEVFKIMNYKSDERSDK